MGVDFDFDAVVFSSASSLGSGFEPAGGGAVRNLLPDEECPSEESTFSSYLGNNALAQPPAALAAPCPPTSDPKPTLVLEHSPSVISQPSDDHDETCMMDGLPLDPAVSGSPILIRQKGAESTSSDSVAPLPSLADLPARTGQSLEIDEASRDPLSPFTIETMNSQLVPPPSSLTSSSYRGEISPLTSDPPLSAQLSQAYTQLSPPADCPSPSDCPPPADCPSPSDCPPPADYASPTDCPPAPDSENSPSSARMSASDRTDSLDLAVQATASVETDQSEDTRSEPPAPPPPPPLTIPTAASWSSSADSSVTGGPPLPLGSSEFEQQELVAYDHTDITSHDEDSTDESPAASSVSLAPVRPVTPPAAKVVMIDEDKNVSHQLMDLPPVSTIRTSREGEFVYVNWMRGNMEIKNITVPLRRCRIRSAAWANDECHVVVEVNSCGSWCITLIPDCTRADPALLRTLCAHIRCDGAEINNEMMRPGVMSSRPVVRAPSRAVATKMRYVSRTPGNLELFLNTSIQDEVLRILQLKMGSSWWSRLLHCCDARRSGGSSLVQSETAAPATGWFVSSPCSKKPASVEWLDEPLALRSLFLVTPLAGTGTELSRTGEAQAVVIAHTIAKLTGNSYSLEGAGTSPICLAHALKVVEALNKRRPKTVRPLKVVAARRIFDPVTDDTDWDETNAAVDAALRGQGPVSLYLNLPPARQKTTSSHFLVNDDLEDALNMSADRNLGVYGDAAKNPASLVGDARVESCQFVPLYRFPYWKPDRITKVLGVSVGHARATTPLIERGTSHQLLMLPGDNIRMLLSEHQGLNANRLRFRDGAILPYLLSPKGVPYFVVGDAGATLAEAAETLTFTPEKVGHDEYQAPPGGLNLLRTESPRSEGRSDHSERQIILIRAGQNRMSLSGRDLGLTALGRRQLIATSAWLGQCFNDADGVLGQPSRWCVAGISGRDEREASLVESLDLFKEVFYQYLPVSMIEKKELERSELMPEALMRLLRSEAQCVCLIFSDERMILRYLADCMGLVTANMRWPHAGFLPISVEQDGVECPTFGTISHLPPALVS